VIEQGGFHRALLDRLTVLEAKQAALRESLAKAPADVPDLHPNIAELYRRKVARLSKALDHPDDRHEAMDTIRQRVTRVVITPSATRGEVHAVLHGDIVAIADRVSQRPAKPRKLSSSFPPLKQQSRECRNRLSHGLDPGTPPFRTHRSRAAPQRSRLWVPGS